MKNSTNDGVSRRGFLSGVGGAAALGLLSAGALSACAPRGAANEGSSQSADQYDLIVVGSGLAGICAALRANEIGTKVLLVEKGSTLGLQSNSIVSGGALATPNDESEESVQKFIDALNTKSKSKSHAGINELIARNIIADLEWIKGYGALIEPATPHLPFDCLKLYVSPGASQGMGPLMQTLIEGYESNGGEVLCDTKLLDFVMDNNGAVSGVKVRSKNGVETIAAKAVIIATGGYVAHKQLLEEFVGPDADAIMMRGSQTITADAHFAALRAGGMLVQMGGDSSLHVGAVSPENVQSGNPSNALGFCLSINSLGQRYTDESKGYVSHGKALMTQPGQVAGLIFDEETKALEKVQQDIKRFDSFGSAPLTANSLDELAELINVPADALKATVEEFNAAVDGEVTHGLAADKEAMARKVVTPPFHAFYPLVPGSIMGFGGLYTNEKMEVLEADGTPIAGLYVAGEAMGGVFMYDYLAGTSLDRCIVTGKAAADIATGAAK